MEPIHANGSITDVTLYRGRAAVTRRTELNLEAGGWSIFFRNLPISATLDSVQASVQGNAKLIAVDTTVFPIEKDTNELLADINKEIEQVEKQIALAQAVEQSIKMQATFLETLVLRSSSDSKQDVDLVAFEEQLAFIGMQKEKFETQKLANKELREELANKRNTLVKRRNSISNESHVQRDAIIDIVVFTHEIVTIEMTYLVGNASWEPSYSIRASEGGEAITIDYDAIVDQHSGEDWKDVNLTLSTAQPQRSASPPKLSPWYVDILQPAPSDPKRGMSRSRVSENTASFASASDANVEGTTLGATLGVAVSAASIVGNGPAVSFALPRTVSVLSNKNDSQKQPSLQ